MRLCLLTSVLFYFNTAPFQWFWLRDNWRIWKWETEVVRCPRFTPVLTVFTPTTSTSLVQPLIRPTKETARTMLDVLHYLGPFIPAFVG